MKSEDSVENITINVTLAESFVVKEVKEETEETDEPLQAMSG